MMKLLILGLTCTLHLAASVGAETENDELWVSLLLGPARGAEETFDALKTAEAGFAAELNSLVNLENSGQRRRDLVKQLEQIRDLLEAGDHSGEKCNNDDLDKFSPLFELYDESPSCSQYVDHHLKQRVVTCEAQMAERFNTAIKSLKKRDDVSSLKENLQKESSPFYSLSSDDNSCICNTIIKDGVASYLKPQLRRGNPEEGDIMRNLNKFTMEYERRVADLCIPVIGALQPLADIYEIIYDDRKPVIMLDQTTKDWAQFGVWCKMIREDLATGSKYYPLVIFEKLNEEPVENPTKFKHPSLASKIFGRCFSPATLE